MPSVFWLAAYNPLLTRAQLTQQAMASDCWAVIFLFQNTPPVERGTCSFTYGLGFCLGTQFFCYEFFKEMWSNSGKKKKKLWKGRREGELTETEMQYLFWPSTEKLKNTLKVGQQNLSCRIGTRAFWTKVLPCSLSCHHHSQLNKNSFILFFHVFT